MKTVKPITKEDFEALSTRTKGLRYQEFIDNVKAEVEKAKAGSVLQIVESPYKLQSLRKNLSAALEGLPCTVSTRSGEVYVLMNEESE